MKINIKKISLLLIIMFFALAPLTAFAADGDAGADDVPQSTVAKLQIPLPFVPENPDLSQYIQGVYRLLIGAGALFAVVMIIIGGYQWIFSGGSSDKTGAAKKRIFGAVIGLMLALLSYIILNTITPRLVSLRLPKVDPVGRIDFEIGETCQTSGRISQLEKDMGYSSGDMPVIGDGVIENTIRDRAYCGNKYYIIDLARAELEEMGRAGQAEELSFEVLSSHKKIDMCTGGYCDYTEACVQGRCIDAIITGTVNWPALSNTYVDKVSVMAICEGAESAGGLIQYKSVGKLRLFRLPWRRGETTDGSIVSYDEKINYQEEGQRFCGGTVLKGFVLKIEVNDDKGAWRNILPTIDNDFALGKEPGTRYCMSAPMIKNMGGGIKKVDFDDINFNLYGKQNFFQATDFPITCDINWIMGT